MWFSKTLRYFNHKRTLTEQGKKKHKFASAESSEIINMATEKQFSKNITEKNMNIPLQLQVLSPMQCPFSLSSSIKFPNIKFTQPVANHWPPLLTIFTVGSKKVKAFY